MATCDQILQLFSPCSKLHGIIVADSSSEKIIFESYANIVVYAVSDAELISVVASLLCLSLSFLNVSLTK